MRARPAEEKAADGSLVAGPIENWTHSEELIESKLAMENVAAGEAVRGFEVLGRDDLDTFDKAGEIRSVRGERSNDSGAKFPAARVPIPFPQFIGSLLNASGEDVPALGSEGRIENRRNGDIEIGRFREIAILGGVEGALEVVYFGADVDAAGESLEEDFGRIERRESRKPAESKIDFGDRAVGTKILDAVGEGRVELGRIEELKKSALGVDAGDDTFDRDFFAIRKHDSRDGAVFDAKLPASNTVRTL